MQGARQAWSIRTGTGLLRGIVGKGRGRLSFPPLRGQTTRTKAAVPLTLPLLAVFGIGAGCDFHSCFQLCPTSLPQISLCLLRVVPTPCIHTGLVPEPPTEPQIHRCSSPLCI